MSPALETVLAHLSALVAFDTRNPPRSMNSTGIFAYLAGQLDGFDVRIDDLGEGCVNLYATRGQPKLLFNFHIDTVPATDEWTGNPFELRVDADRATGLGACDIKGAAACMLAAAAHTSGDVALLFSSDEEAGSSKCINAFLESGPAFDGAVIAEPTGGKAILAHRGIASARMLFRGTSGHSSAGRALTDSALHRAVRWAGRALEFAGDNDTQRYDELSGLRFNIGRIEGGIKPNMIAATTEVRFGFRALPGQDSTALLTKFFQLAEPHELSGCEITFQAPSLPARQGQSQRDSEKLAQSLELPSGEPVDFWTEAALFSAAGIPALVYGPGDIAQAHSAGEWVALTQLSEVTDTYTRLLT